MYHLGKIPDGEEQNYRTLHHDIGMVKHDNGQWDLWFENGDTVSATEFHSLQVGIIIACLTSWNYLNRYGNPTYEIFGNESYSLLKQNKSETVKFKIKAYFEECLNRMRRVESVENLEVHEIEGKPYNYMVTFVVRAMGNVLINDSFEISYDIGKSSSYLQYSYNQPYSSLENPLEIHLQLFTEYGQGLEGEIVYVYLNDEFIGIQGSTDEQGRISFRLYPEEIDYDAELRFEFHGNANFNGCISETLTFSSIPFHFNVDDDGMLYVTSPVDGITNYIWLGELLRTYDDIPLNSTETNKLYLLKDEDYSTAYIVTNGVVSARFRNVECTGSVGEAHLFIEDGEGLYELGMDNHVYYIGA